MAGSHRCTFQQPERLGSLRLESGVAHMQLSTFQQPERLGSLRLVVDFVLHSNVLFQQPERLGSLRQYPTNSH